MIGKGSLVRYLGKDTKHVWHGKLVFVHDRNGDTLTVYTERNDKGKWKTTTIPVSEVEAVVA